MMTSTFRSVTPSALPSVARRPFGQTGMQVGLLGFGAAEIGFEKCDDRTVDRLAGLAVDLGINVIDTAAMYADSEQKLGNALRSRRRHVHLFTKCRRLAPPRYSFSGLAFRLGVKRQLRLNPQRPGTVWDWHPRALQWNIDQSLRRLKTDYLDVVQLHSCSEDVLRSGEAVEVLVRARKAGKCRFIGYSGDNESAIAAIDTGHFDAVQMSINIADQEGCGSVAAAARRGLGVVAKRPIANALWKHRERPSSPDYQAYWQRLRELKYDFMASERAFEMALRFTISVPGVNTAIVGTTSPKHLLQNAKYAGMGPLSEDEFKAIRLRWQQRSNGEWEAQM